MKKSIVATVVLGLFTFAVFLIPGAPVNKGTIQQTPANGNLSTEPTTWGERYIQDNCRRCPECCVEIP